MKSFNLTDLALEATDLHYFHQRQDIPLHCFLMINVTINSNIQIQVDNHSYELI